MTTGVVTPSGFAEGLGEISLGLQAVVDEHLEDQEGELLLHLLMGDVRRWCVSTFNLDDEDGVVALLELLDMCLGAGTDELKNAVSVSFIEDCALWDRRMSVLFETWPQGMRTEAESMGLTPTPNPHS